MFGDVHQPSTKKIEYQERNQNGSEKTGIKPIYEAELIFFAPVAKDHNKMARKV